MIRHERFIIRNKKREPFTQGRNEKMKEEKLPEPPTSDCFRAAAARMLNDKGHGSRKALAKKLGVGKQYVSNMISGRARINDDNKDQIAQFLEVSVPEMLTAGYLLLTTGYWFIHQEKVNQAPLTERPLLIVQLAAKDAGVRKPEVITEACVYSWHKDMVEAYIEGTMSSAEFYHHALMFFKDTFGLE